MTESRFSRVRCDDCDETIVRTLVEIDGTLRERLACGCHIYEPTTGRYVPMPNDIPDKWSDIEFTPTWDSEDVKQFKEER